MLFQHDNRWYFPYIFFRAIAISATVAFLLFAKQLLWIVTPLSFFFLRTVRQYQIIICFFRSFLALVNTKMATFNAWKLRLVANILPVLAFEIYFAILEWAIMQRMYWLRLMLWRVWQGKILRSDAALFGISLQIGEYLSSRIPRFRLLWLGLFILECRQSKNTCSRIVKHPVTLRLFSMFVGIDGI